MELTNGVFINKLSGGLGRRTPDLDMVSGLLFNGADTDDLVDDQIYRLSSVEDAEKLGITAAYDTGGQSAFYQISQFFRINPSGDLFIMKANQNNYGNLVAEAMNMLDLADGQIRQLGVIHSTSKGFDATITALGKAQVVASAAYADHKPVEIILEGKGFGDTTVSGVDNLGEENAENVSIVIAMDPQKAKEVPEGSDPDTIPNYSNTAAVGVLLGAISKAKVSENIGWIEKFNLTGDGFRSAGFVGGGEIKTEGDLKTLNDKRFIFARTHVGIGGVYFNDSHTCTELTSDFAYIEANRTIHKASRIARTALLPKVNSPVLVDPDTGKLPPSVTKGFETLCRSALERMISNEEASEIDVYVDPNQDILADSELKIKISIVPLGTARRIVVDLGFKNPFQINAAANA